RSLSRSKEHGRFAPPASFRWTWAPVPLKGESLLSALAPLVNSIEPSDRTWMLPKSPWSELTVTPPRPTPTALPGGQVHVPLERPLLTSLPVALPPPDARAPPPPPPLVSALAAPPPPAAGFADAADPPPPPSPPPAAGLAAPLQAATRTASA